MRPRLEMLEDRLTPSVFTPTTFADDGSAGSLRQMLIQVNNDNGTGTDTIQLSAGTYKLTLANANNTHELLSATGDLNIDNDLQPVVIQGATDANGNPTSIIDQTVADRVFQIVNPGTTVTFKNLIIEGGKAQEFGSSTVAGQSNALGGGILDNAGNVTLSNVVVQSNQAVAGTGFNAQGGGIYVQDGTLTVKNSVIQKNTAAGGAAGLGDSGEADGGGVYIVSTGQAQGPVQLTITNSAVVGNVAEGGIGASGFAGGGAAGGDAHGGGIYSQADTNTITASTLASNVAEGGTSNQGNPFGVGSGGGAELYGVNTIVNSTIVANSTTGSDASGGGVNFAAGASGQLTNITVVGNSAKLSGTLGNAEGGGLDNNNGDVQNVTLTNSVVAGNTVTTSAGSPQSPDVRGQIVSGGHNLIGIADGVNDPGFTAPGDKAGSAANPLNPLLGVLQNNGGPTQTMLPLPGSPALGAGDPSQAPSTDQRGQLRPVGGPTDIGAVQVSGVSTTPPSTPPSMPPTGTSASSSSQTPSLFEAIISIYIAELEKDLGMGNPVSLQASINFYSQYTVFMGFNIASFIEQLADAGAQSAFAGRNQL